MENTFVSMKDSDSTISAEGISNIPDKEPRCFFREIGSQISQDWNAASQNCLCPQMTKIV